MMIIAKKYRMAVVLAACVMALPPVTHAQSYMPDQYFTDSFEFKPLLNPKKNTFPGAKNVSVAEMKFSIDGFQAVQPHTVYLGVRTGDTDEPWKSFKTFILKNKNKTIAKIDASKESSWQKSSTSVPGLAYYFVAFENIKGSIKEGARTKYLIQTSLQSKIPSSTPGYMNDETAILFFFPIANGLLFTSGPKTYTVGIYEETYKENFEEAFMVINLARKQYKPAEDRY